MSRKNVDNSIFESIKLEIKDLLSNYEVLSLADMDEELTSTMHIVDKECIDKLLVFEKRLIMEYGYNESILKKHKLDQIVKVINRDYHTHYYKLYRKETWEQVNDRDKVRARLEVKFIKWKNAYRKFTLRKLSKDATADIVASIKANIETEIAKGKKELEYIIENFDNLDVRISEYEIRKAYTAVVLVENKVFKRVTLRKSVFNVLWVQELTEEEKNSELTNFFKGATKAFGSIFYKPL